MLGILLSFLYIPQTLIIIPSMSTTTRDYVSVGEVLLSSLLAPSSSNRYGSPASITWSPPYAATTECASFTSLLLTHAYSWSPAAQSPLSTFLGPTPDATVYHDSIAQDVTDSLFMEVRQVSSIQRGDIIAIKYPVGLPATGHMMVIRSPPSAITPSPPVIPGTTQMQVLVLDSTQDVHGIGDTRTGTATGTGIGSGYFRIYVAANDTIVGYSWSLLSVSTYYRQSERFLVVGRINQAQLAADGYNTRLVPNAGMRSGRGLDNRSFYMCFFFTLIGGVGTFWFM